MIKESCDYILAQPTALGRPVHGLLQEGLRQDAVLAGLSKLQLPALAELQELLMWRNGTRIDAVSRLSDAWFFPWQYLMSLEEATVTYRAMEGGWDRNWFPIAASGGGGYHLVECSTGMIYVADATLAEEQVAYLSMSAMFSTIAKCFERRVYYVDSGGTFEIDDVARVEIAQAYNPGVQYWLERGR